MIEAENVISLVGYSSEDLLKMIQKVEAYNVGKMCYIL